MTDPTDGSSVSAQDLVDLFAQAVDDAGVSEVSFYIDDVLLYTDGPTTQPTPTTFNAQAQWNTDDPVVIGSRHDIKAIAKDIDTHETTSQTVEVTVRAPHCFNDTQDEDEVGDACESIINCPATAIYGKHSTETELLRYFRDNVLNQTHEVQEIIRLYYQWSPVILEAIIHDVMFKKELNEMLDQILLLIKLYIE